MYNRKLRVQACLTTILLLGFGTLSLWAQAPPAETPKPNDNSQSTPTTCDKATDRPCIDQPHEGDTQVTGQVILDSGKKPKNTTVDVKVNSTSEGAPETVNDDGTFSKTLKHALGQYDSIEAVQSGDKSGSTGTVQVTGPASTGSQFDFGRVRVIMSAGAIVSQDQGQFSKTSAYVDLNVDNTWFMGNPTVKGFGTKGWHSQVNTGFGVRLTALPVAACNSSGTTGTSSSTCTASNDTFVSTPKAALVLGSLYFPTYWRWSSWKRTEKSDSGNDMEHRYALYMAPLVKGGMQTLLQTVQNASNASSGTGTGAPSVTTPNGQTFFHFYAVGARLGLFKFHDHEQTSGQGSVAPDSLLYLDVGGGKYENFPKLNSQGQVVDHPWRLSMEGRFNLPKLPIFLGFNSNTHVANNQGELRFLFGTSFDVGCLLKKLGVNNGGIGSCDTETPSKPAAKSAPGGGA